MGLFAVALINAVIFPYREGFNQRFLIAPERNIFKPHI